MQATNQNLLAFLFSIPNLSVLSHISHADDEIIIWNTLPLSHIIGKEKFLELQIKKKKEKTNNKI